MKLLTKIDAVTAGLLQLQHRLYPWLVPAYRTIHRTKPRRLIFRAIRWVSPERHFPLMSKSKEDFDRMDEAELKKAIIQLNDIRKEALAIGNRYDQMIDLISLGQLPYRIMWPENKWMSMADRLDRANRLKKGTDTWEKSIDKKAVELRKAMLDKGIKLQDVSEIWDPIPAFKDPKKKYQPLRRVKEPQDPEARREAEEIEERGEPFKLPSPEEFREGEKQIGHRTHEGHVAPVSMGEYIVRGPVTAKEDTPEGFFPGWDVSIQEAREQREREGLVPDENWTHGKKSWDTTKITKVHSSPEESDAPTPKKAKDLDFVDDEKGVFITPSRPEAIMAAKMSYLVDRALGLNVTPRVAEKTIGDQVGYLEEQVTGVDELDMSDEQWNDVLSNRGARDSLYGIHLLDMVTGQTDRDGGNLKFDPDARKFYGVTNENAFGGGERMEYLSQKDDVGMAVRSFPGDSSQYEAEIGEYFDAHYSAEKSIGIIDKYELDFNNLRSKNEGLRDKFIESAMKFVTQGVG